MTEHHTHSCTNPGKVPRIDDWRRKATDDTGTIEEWFNWWPDSNLGMITGSEVEIIAIDVDGAYGQERLEELIGGEIPLTWQYSTPGGGMRYLFEIQKGLALRKYTDKNPAGGHEELAILVDGQMTVTPPSRHLNGGKYAWLPGRGPGDVPLAAAPEAILRKVSVSPEMGVHLTNEPGTDLRNRAGSGQHSECDQDSQQEQRPPSLLPTGDSVLDALASKCDRMRGYVAEQLGSGCDEETWFRVVSMLERSGHPGAAYAFSKLSAEHDERSERRIKKLTEDVDEKVHGPTLCVTFGCSANDVRNCFGNIRRNKTGKITNTPAALIGCSKVERGKPLTEKIEEEAALLYANYKIDGHHLCQMGLDKKGNLKTYPIANFFAWIAKDVIKDDGVERQRFYVIEGVILPTGRTLPPVRVPAEEFEGLRWLAKWGPEPNIHPGNNIRDTVRHAIQSTARGAEGGRIYAHLGWLKIEGHWAYLHAGGAVGADEVEVDLDPRLQNYALPISTRDARQAMQTSLNLLDVAPHRMTLAMWALVFLAPLCEWLRLVELEPNFLVWLHGYTGTRKTTIAKLFLSHFGSLRGHPPASFKDTANSLEKRAFDAKDSLLLVDDFHPTTKTKEAQAMTEVAHKLLRSYGDRVARGRMKQDTTLRSDYPPRGMAVVTAEDTIEVGSSVARLFPVELRQNDVDLDKLTEAQRQSHSLTEAMVGYLEWVATAMTERDDERLTKLFYNRRAEANRLKVHGRLVEAAAWLYLGLSTGLDYALHLGVIGQDERERLLGEAWELFLDTADEQGERIEEIKPTTLFLDIVAELLANRTIYTIPTQSASFEVPPNRTHVGWKDEEYFYFLPEIIYKTVSKFLSEQGKHFPVSKNVLWKQLAEEGATHTETSKENGKVRLHTTVKKSTDGNDKRKLWVRAELLVEKKQEKKKQETKNPSNKQPNTGLELEY